MSEDSPNTEEIQPESTEQAADASPADTSPDIDSEAPTVVPDLPAASGDRVEKKKKNRKNKNKAAKQKSAELDNHRGTNRGIETMFRVTFQNHIELTGLADNKANTLININGIIISLVIALVSPRIASNSWMMIPALILNIGCMVSLGYAIFASRPRLITTLIDKEMVIRNDAEILFFGNFVNMSAEEFQDTMNELLGNRNLLYDNMTRNLYFMGKVLERKYRLLKYSYTVFFMTLAMAVVFFIGMFIGMAG